MSMNSSGCLAFGYGLNKTALRRFCLPIPLRAVIVSSKKRKTQNSFTKLHAITRSLAPDGLLLFDFDFVRCVFLIGAAWSPIFVLDAGAEEHGLFQLFRPVLQRYT